MLRLPHRLPRGSFSRLSLLLLCLVFWGLTQSRQFAPAATPAASVAAASQTEHAAPISPPSSPAAPNSPESENPVPLNLLALFVILALAKIGGDLMERIKQPAVLGELLLGVIFGNIALLGIHFAPLQHLVLFLRTDVVIRVLAELGVVLLLFEVGLESTVKEMAQVGVSSFLVALLGVIAPFILGWGVCVYFLPHANMLVHVFIGSILCATSVGITARVLQDIGRIHTREAKIILGAAVIDDVMGLIVLAVVQGIITASNAGAHLELGSILWIVGKSTAFFLGAILLGLFFSPKLYTLASYLQAKGLLLSISLMICLLSAWVASLIGLAPIVGAFCAGLVMDDTTFLGLGDYRRHELEELIQPIVALLVPVFFVRMGVMVQLEYFGHREILGFALALTAVAILGKQVCMLGIVQKGIDRVAVGLGMIPRGEVGLIVASIGMGLVANGQRVIEQGTYSAVVIMVMVTTLVTPPILAHRMRKQDRRRAVVEVEQEQRLEA